MFLLSKYLDTVFLSRSFYFLVAELLDESRVQASLRRTGQVGGAVATDAYVSSALGYEWYTEPHARVRRFVCHITLLLVTS